MRTDLVRAFRTPSSETKPVLDFQDYTILHRKCLRTAERLVQDAYQLLLSQGFSREAATAELIGMITAVKLRGDLETALTGEAA